MRETVRYVAVFGFIAMLIIGTISTVYIASSPATVGSTTSPTAAPTNALSSLATKGDQAIASGDYAGGIAYYRAYLASQQSSPDPNVMFSLGKAYVDTKNPKPDYLLGLAYLQQAEQASPSATWAQQASALISQYASQANAEATTTAVAALSATQVATGTTSVPASGTSAPATGSDAAPQARITATTTITK